MVLNKKILYVNGCSWVEGDELKFKKKSRFSHLLSTELNLKEINWGMSGCSNERIIISTMKWIYKNQKLLNETMRLHLMPMQKIYGCCFTGLFSTSKCYDI